MRLRIIAYACVGILALAGCTDQNETSAPPPPVELTSAAIGHYCGMNVLEHSGPKGQILLKSRAEPVWFSSVRDTLSFTMLPEEPKDISAIYVSDMGRAETWEEPGASNWVDARQALFVIDSRLKGGMGADELIPFSARDAADAFVSQNGGRVLSFADIPKGSVLGSDAGATGAVANEPHGMGKAPDHATPAAKSVHSH